MSKFIKAISLTLALAIFCLPLSAAATDNSVLYGDPNYVVGMTDLNDATGTESDSTNFGLYDSGEEDHGKVFLVPSAGWMAIGNGKTGITYTYNSKTLTLFNEPLEKNSYYILSYDHKSFPAKGSTLNDGARFSIALPVIQYVTSSGTDWRDHPPASDNVWSRYSTVFYSENLTAFNGKINTLSTNTLSYVDNIKLVKAMKLEVYNPGGTKLDTDGTGLMYSEKLKGYFAEMGQPLTLKKLGNDVAEDIVSVTHNGIAVEEVNGAYTIPSVTGEISLSFGLKIDKIEAQAGVKIHNNNVYADVGDTYAKFLAKFGMPFGVIEFYNEEEEKLDKLNLIESGVSAKVSYEGNVIRNYNVKLNGDIFADGTLNVSDVVSMLDGIVEKSIEDEYQADLNDSGRVTVSDLVRLRMLIMEGNKQPERIKILAIGNSFSIDATAYVASVAKAVGYDLDDVVVGNLYYSGCSLKQHVEFLRGETGAYGFQYYKNSTSYTTRAETSLKYALELEDWDYITIQQASHDSGKYSTFEPYATELINYVKQFNPDVKFLWHMTWAYPQTPPAGYESHQNFVDYDSNQITMYNAIVNASSLLASTKTEIEGVLPVGSAIQNLRDKVGDVVTRDQFHLNGSYARLTAALTWIKFITGKDLDDVRTDSEIIKTVRNGVNDLAERGVTITAEDLMDAVIKSANDAVANPSTITK